MHLGLGNPTAVQPYLRLHAASSGATKGFIQFPFFNTTYAVVLPIICKETWKTYELHVHDGTRAKVLHMIVKHVTPCYINTTPLSAIDAED